MRVRVDSTRNRYLKINFEFDPHGDHPNDVVIWYGEHDDALAPAYVSLETLEHIVAMFVQHPHRP